MIKLMVRSVYQFSVATFQGNGKCSHPVDHLVERGDFVLMSVVRNVGIARIESVGFL